MSNRVLLPPKLANETIFYSQFDFLSLFASSVDSIISILSVTASVYSGIDPSPSAIIVSQNFLGSVVTVGVSAGVVGVIYEIAVKAGLASGQSPVLRGYLAVIPDLP